MHVTEIPAHVPHRIAEDVSAELDIEVTPEDVQAVLDGEITSDRSFRVAAGAFQAIVREAQTWGLAVGVR